MRAYIDETTPEDKGGIYYVAAAAILLADPADADAALAAVLPPGRTRPFHWSREGPQARSRLLDCLQGLGGVAHVCVHYPTGRARQEEARAAVLAAMLPKLLVDGVDELWIESRDADQDKRDQALILDVLARVHPPGGLSYGWHPKPERGLWLADGVCGAVREYLLGKDRQPLQQLQRTRVVGELHYLAPSRGQEMRKPRLPP